MAQPRSPGQRKHKISAIITTYNEERNIGPCIESLLWCDEIVVVDSYSTDRTCEIIAEYPEVHLLQHPYYGAAAQKNWATDQSIHPWVLILDADERCTEELRDEIDTLLIEDPPHNHYRMLRRLFFLEQRVRFSGFQRDDGVRLFRRGTARYPNRRVHTDMKTEGTTPLLQNAIDHYMVKDLGEYLHRITKYGIWGAAQGWRDNRSSNPLEFIIRPLWRFIRAYVFQLGILDGVLGFIFCLIQAYGTFVKWVVLWSWRVGARFGLEPVLPDFDESSETWTGEERNRVEGAGNTSQAATTDSSVDG